VPKYGLTVPVLESAQKATIFGIHLYDKLLFPHTPGMGLVPSIVAAITVALSATTTFMTVRQTSKRGLMQTNLDPDNPAASMQKYMMYIVPFFSLTGLYWQYGLVLYWLTTNVWTLGQQYFMFRNWTVEETQAASTLAAPARSTQSSARPASAARTGPAKTGTAKTGTAKTATAKTATGTAKTASGETKSGFDPRGPKTASGETKSDFDPRAPKAASGSARTGPANGRPASGTPRPKTGSGSGSGASSTTGRVQTGSAARDAAANTPGPANGQNGGAKRGLLRLGRPKAEPVPEPEVPATKVVRQQPVRQSKSKRSGKS
jgi:YidC/Oxa1 family membrane protein insertase